MTDDGSSSCVRSRRFLSARRGRFTGLDTESSGDEAAAEPLAEGLSSLPAEADCWQLCSSSTSASARKRNGRIPRSPT